MCGIAGYTGSQRPGLLEAMLRPLAHRGPDGEGFHSEPGIHLAVCRLAIVDRAGGFQPRGDESGTRWVVQNGEIYNHAQLRRDLTDSGHRFATASDTEALVHLFEERGAAGLDALDGMFALAYFDRAGRALMLARDRLGEKPLYYARQGGELYFASEIKSLLAVPGIGREVDPVALDDYLALQSVTGSRTLFAGISKLPPGHRLEWIDGSMKVERWWTPPEPGADPLDAAQLRALLEESVRRRLPGEVKAGCFLSGGVDSGGIAALMAAQASERLRTYTAGFDVPGAGDERALARALAARLGAEHAEIVVAAPDAQKLLELAWHMDHPPANPAGIALMELSRQAREHVTVVLTGEGADELFGGYGKYAYPRLAAHVAQPVARTLGAVLSRLPARGRTATLWKLGRVLLTEGDDARFAVVNAVFDDAARRALRPSGSVRSGSELVEAVCGPPDGRLFDRMMRFDLATYLPEDNLMKVDRTTMAYGLEARAPYLSATIVERALATPAEARAGRGGTKKLLREALRPLLPREALARKKAAFELPMDRWLAREWAGLVDAALDPARLARQGLFDPHSVARLRAGANARQLWTLLAFQLWHMKFIDERKGAGTWHAG